MIACWYRRGAFTVRALVREGEGPTVVLLHGAAGNALSWLPLLPALGDRRLVLVDLPGHGESPAVEDWSLAVLAEELAAAISAVHPEPLTWVGHSWGGKVAALLAARAPERVARLVLVDPSPATPVPVVPEDFVAGAFAPELGPWPSLAAARRAAQALPQYAAWGPEVQRSFERGLDARADGTVVARVRREWLVAIVEAALLGDDAAAIATIACPTLLVVAEESLFWQEPTNLAVLGRHANVETATFAGHHWIHWAAPGPVGERIAAWLGRFDV